MKVTTIILKNLHAISLLLLLSFTTNFLNQQSALPIITVSKQERAINIDKNFFQFFNLGQKRLIVALLWIQTILESDHQHYKKKDLNSWMFLRFNTITYLDPLFLEAYQFAGVYLSIVKDDKLGAKYIYETGLKYFPDDFSLNFNAGFHYFSELHDLELAYKYLSKIQYHPKALKFLPSLVARIKAQSGELENARSLLEVAYAREPEKSPFKERYYNSLYAINAEIDLNCLNRQEIKDNKDRKVRTTTCNQEDFDGNPYLKNEEGKFSASKQWRAFRAHTHR